MRFLLLGTLFLVSACAGGTTLSKTTQNVQIDLVGTDEAYCVLSNASHKYAINAPGVRVIQRSENDLKVDCRDNFSDRRRTVTVNSSDDGSFSYKYPDVIKIDFSMVENGSRYNGYRIEQTSFSKTLDSVLTEDSYNEPVVTTQEYPVKKKYAMGRRSHPISLTGERASQNSISETNATSYETPTPYSSHELTPSPSFLDPSVSVYPSQ